MRTLCPLAPPLAQQAGLAWGGGVLVAIAHHAPRIPHVPTEPLPRLPAQVRVVHLGQRCVAPCPQRICTAVVVGVDLHPACKVEGVSCLLGGGVATREGVDHMQATREAVLLPVLDEEHLGESERPGGDLGPPLARSLQKQQGLGPALQPGQCVGVAQVHQLLGARGVVRLALDHEAAHLQLLLPPPLRLDPSDLLSRVRAGGHEPRIVRLLDVVRVNYVLDAHPDCADEQRVLPLDVHARERCSGQTCRKRWHRCDRTSAVGKGTRI
eukprot:scaffold920_cov63-Phaeocystis_antarctica.AAC.5